MKTNTLDKYEGERKVVKGVFWFTLISHISIYYILPYLNYDICAGILSGFCKNFYYIKSFYLSLIFVFLLPVFFMNKNIFVKWKIVFYIISIATIINLLRDETYNDFLSIGYMPTAIYIYTIGFVWSLFIIFKNRE